MREALAYKFSELEDARLWLEDMGLTCIPRDPSDDLSIVESWV